MESLRTDYHSLLGLVNHAALFAEDLHPDSGARLGEPRGGAGGTGEVAVAQASELDVGALRQSLRVHLSEKRRKDQSTPMQSLEARAAMLPTPPPFHQNAPRTNKN